MNTVQLTHVQENHNDDDFVFQPMLTYIGNKRKLVHYINHITSCIKLTLKKDKLNIFDGFCGSTVVARKLLSITNTIYTNDLEPYSYLMAKCFVEKPSIEQQHIIKNHIDIMNVIADNINNKYYEGIISKFYSPQNTHSVQIGERCFYTRENGLIIDTLRKYIDEHVEHDLQLYCLVPLLIKASIHTNTSGVFKGFYKDGEKGAFGGKGKNALSRIMKRIKLDMPIWNNNNYDAICYNQNTNDLISVLPNNIDLIYLDPPYNQHPYGSNYFMLNLIIDNKLSENVPISKVSGIPSNWNKSNYNKKENAINDMKHLINVGLTKSNFLLISYNNEGIISTTEWNELLKSHKVIKYEIVYNTFKGSRNLKNRSNKVIEILYLIYN